MLAVLPAMASAYDDKINGIYYNFDQSAKTAEVTYYDYLDNQNAYSGTVNIPPTVDYNGVPYSVTSIGDFAFVNCSGLISVTIPNSVTSIGYSAFRVCSGLKSLTIPNSVTSIGQYAFSGCSGLTSVTIPNSVTSIEGSTFDGCSGLTSVTIPISVTSIGSWAFTGCSGLTSVTIPNSVTSIGVYAFSSCSGLTSVTIPNSVTSIGQNVFAGCSGLTSVTIPNSVTSIWDFAFSGCSALTFVTIPNSVTSIRQNAFWGCSILTSVISLIESPFAINENVFPDYSSATLYVPKGTKDKYKATSGWNQFQKIEEIGNFIAVLIDGIYYNLNQDTQEAEVTNSKGGDYDGYSSYSGSVVIPSSVTFGGATYNVTSIGEQAFLYCDLTSVTIPNSVTSIASSAFEGCNLNSLTIPNSVASIGEHAFSGAELFSVTIGSGVRSIGESAFEQCRNLLTVTSLIDNPFEISESIFMWEGNFTSATLMVPKGTKKKYEATPAWNLFQRIKEFVVPGDVNIDGAVDVADISSVIDVMAQGTNDPIGDVNADNAVDVADIGTIIDIMAGKDVVIKPASLKCPDEHHPHWIDLGLASGTLWACCNVGANAIEEYGNHYDFDEAQRYNPPSTDQISELLENTDYKWTTQNGVEGMRFTGINKRAVFLPAAGAVLDGELVEAGEYGNYWSSVSNTYEYGFNLEIDKNRANRSIRIRSLKQSVRPVR